MITTKYITFRASIPLAKRLKAIASARHQTVSQLLRMVLEDWIKKNGNKEAA